MSTREAIRSPKGHYWVLLDGDLGGKMLGVPGSVLIWRCSKCKMYMVKRAWEREPTFQNDLRGDWTVAEPECVPSLSIAAGTRIPWKGCAIVGAAICLAIALAFPELLVFVFCAIFVLLFWGVVIASGEAFVEGLRKPDMRIRRRQEGRRDNTRRPAKTSQLAIWSFVVSLLVFLPIINSVVAIVLAVLALWRIRRSNGALRGEKLSYAALIIAACCLALCFASMKM